LLQLRGPQSEAVIHGTARCTDRQAADLLLLKAGSKAPPLAPSARIGQDGRRTQRECGSLARRSDSCNPTSVRGLGNLSRTRKRVPFRLPFWADYGYPWAGYPSTGPSERAKNEESVTSEKVPPPTPLYGNHQVRYWNDGSHERGPLGRSQGR
jgi:hypothetical protein